MKINDVTTEALWSGNPVKNQPGAKTSPLAPALKTIGQNVAGTFTPSANLIKQNIPTKAQLKAAPGKIGNAALSAGDTALTGLGKGVVDYGAGWGRVASRLGKELVGKDPNTPWTTKGSVPQSLQYLAYGSPYDTDLKPDHEGEVFVVRTPTGQNFFKSYTGRWYQQASLNPTDFSITHPLDDFKDYETLDNLVATHNFTRITVAQDPAGTTKFTAVEPRRQVSRKRGAVEEIRMPFIDSILNEVAGAPARTPHPEDAIFDGAAAAGRMVSAMAEVIKNPGGLTIKWDGFPALLFGRGADGRFSIMDKYMFDKADAQIHSPEDWVTYDERRGKNRGDLYQNVANIWAGLEAACGNATGYFWGDLLWAHPLKPTGGVYVFKPNVVEYQVPANSSIGNQIKGRQGGIVVHTYLADRTAKPQPWNGQGLKFDAPVAVLTPSAGVKFQLNDPVKLRRAAETAVQRSAQAADKFFAGIDDKARAALKTYVNKTITGQIKQSVPEYMTDAVETKKISQKLYKSLIGENQGGYFYRNQQGWAAAMQIWNTIYAYKMNLAQQLETQVSGIKQSVNGQPQGEGFVFSTAEGPIKLVQRSGFSQALFAKMA
jgi:hypothetical protein